MLARIIPLALFQYSFPVQQISKNGRKASDRDLTLNGKEISKKIIATIKL